MQHAEVERLASEHLVDPSDLWRVHPTHDEFVTEDGTINADLVAEAAAYLRARQVSSIELTRALLSRIENVDSRLHAYAAVTPKR